MTTDQLIFIAGAVLSLLFSYFPALVRWYEPKSPTEKRQIMAVWLFIVTAVIFAASCSPFLVEIVARFGAAVECSTKSAYELIYLYLIAIVANQTIFLISPKRPFPEPEPYPIEG